MHHINFSFKGLWTFVFLSILFISNSELSAQTVFWSDNFDMPSGGASNNNAGAGWSGSTNTPGGGANTELFGLSNIWVIGSGGTCVSGNSLYVGNTLSAGNQYISDFDTDKLNATPNISTIGVTGISLDFT
ncbi:MAG: hypothetical protein WED33_01770, partial [Bacteroidia bacterium]